jgi:hypothetical protein
MALPAIIISTLCYIWTTGACIIGKDYPHALMWFAYALANMGLLWYEWTKVGQ